MRPRTAGDLLAKAPVPALLITNLVNIRYLTGLQVTAGVLLILPRKQLFFVDARYSDMASRVFPSITVRDIAEIDKVFKDIRECAFEAEDVTVLRKLQWKKKFPATTFVRSTGIVEVFRRTKDKDELLSLKRAHRITRELLRRVPAVIRRPITEEQLARKLAIWALELGADGLSFDPIVAFGSHTACPHHRPTSRLLKKGHIVQIDVGAKVNGYCADMSQVYFTAPPTPLQKSIYAALLEAMKAAMLAAKAGVSNRLLDQLVRKRLMEEGIEEFFTHALGHGVGLDVHEGPTLSQKAKDVKLLSGEVLAVEPGVYFPEKFGMRVEEMVYVQ